MDPDNTSFVAARNNCCWDSADWEETRDALREVDALHKIDPDEYKELLCSRGLTQARTVVACWVTDVITKFCDDWNSSHLTNTLATALSLMDRFVMFGERPYHKYSLIENNHNRARGVTTIERNFTEEDIISITRVTLQNTAVVAIVLATRLHEYKSMKFSDFEIPMPNIWPLHDQLLHAIDWRVGTPLPSDFVPPSETKSIISTLVTRMMLFEDLCTWTRERLADTATCIVNGEYNANVFAAAEIMKSCVNNAFSGIVPSRESPEYWIVRDLRQDKKTMVQLMLDQYHNDLVQAEGFIVLLNEKSMHDRDIIVDGIKAGWLDVEGDYETYFGETTSSGVGWVEIYERLVL